MKTEFTIINHGVPQLMPGNFQSDKSQRKGVGRKDRLCVGMSIKICKR